MADVEINLEITNPQELIGLGLRAYAIGDFTNAAAAYGRATQLLAQEHGDEHDSLGEVLLNYGRALLEVSREESEPLGDAIPQGESDSDSDEVEGENGVTDGAENKEEAPENKSEDDEKPTEKTEGIEKPEGESKDAKTGDDTKPAESTDEINVEKKDEVSQNGETKTEEKTDDEEKAGGSGDNEECTDLQLAWEVLEVAKRIFSKRGNAGKGLLSETLVLLGEVAMESENFTDGVNDIKAGLELQQSAYEPTSRKLAETYYKLGMALSTVSNIEEAVTNFEMSIKTLKARIELLKKTLQEEGDEKVEKPAEDKVTEKDEKSEGDEKEKSEKDGEEKDKTDEDAVKEAKSKAAKKLLMKEEIKDMEALIPEIEEKINDTKSIKEEMATKLMQELTSKPKSSDGAGCSKAATDISHLVKRKRKSEEEIGEQAIPTKKPSP